MIKHTESLYNLNMNHTLTKLVRKQVIFSCNIGVRAVIHRWLLLSFKMHKRDSKKSRKEGIATRSDLTNWFLGSLISELSATQLPTTIEILSYYLYLRETTSDSKYVSKEERAELFKNIVPKITEIWKGASIFTIRKDNDIKRKIGREVDKLEEIFSNHSNHRGDESWIQMKKNEKFSGLFDIALCKCYPKLRKQCDIEKKPPTLESIPHKNCKCQVAEKIPEREWEFYLDQNHERKRFIELGRSGIDQKGSSALQKDLAKAEKHSQKEERLQKQREREYSQFKSVKPSASKYFSGEESSDEESNPSSDHDFEFNIKYNKWKWNYTNTTSFAMRHGLSHRQIMGMINMVLKDMGEVDQSKYVSRKKVRNMISKHGKNLEEEHYKDVEHKAIVFDGKKNYNALKHCQSNLEENITVISEPGGSYLHHFTPKSGSGKDIGRVLFDVMIEYDSQETLIAVGSDGTPSNTSPSIGAIRYLELNIEREVNYLYFVFRMVYV